MDRRVQNIPKGNQSRHKEPTSNTFKKDENHQEDFQEEIYRYPKFDLIQAVWTPVILKRFNESPQNQRVLRFDHYLVITLNYDSKKNNEQNPVTLLIVDLRDNSVQETQIHDESWILDDADFSQYSLTKYKDNQIIKFGKVKGGKVVMTLITIESFQPFQTKCEDIVADGFPDVKNHTAQIHKDSLYVFSVVENKGYLWRFDIKNSSWEIMNPAGEEVSGNFNLPLSFVFEDNLYLYGQTDQGVWILNFEKMTWRKFHKKVLHFKECNVDQSLYKGHAIFLDEYPVDHLCSYEEARIKSKNHEVISWQITPNPYMGAGRENQIRKTKKISTDYHLRRTTVVYNSYLITFGSRWVDNDKRNEFCMFAMDLNYLELKIPKSEEDKRFESLFMNKEKADITFKVQGKQFPACKEVLIKRSKYFANVLKKNTTESLIEIEDCDQITFKGFLRYLYFSEIHLLEGLSKEMTMKLIVFADKYQQYDLRDRCVELLKFNLNSNNVLKALDLACQLRLPLLKNTCIDFLKNKIDIDNISRIIQFLEKQENPEIKAHTITFVLENFEKISVEDLGLYENFLVKNFGTDTIALFAQAAYSENGNNYGGKWVSELSKDGITDLKLVLLNFAAENLEEIEKKEIFQDLPKEFLTSLVLIVLENNSSNLLEKGQ